MPSSSPSNLMYLTATSLLFLSTALKTLPKAPSPMTHNSVYPSISFIVFKNIDPITSKPITIIVADQLERNKRVSSNGKER